MESIDVFDTAIFRDVFQPTDIFTLIEEKVGRNFKKLRIDAEKRARSISVFSNIKDIYKYLVGFDLQMEIDMEMNHVYPNEQILEMYNKNPSNYVFISDMYLPSKIIKELLEKCGYISPKVFVSCEERCNKGSGLLFQKVERRIGKITKHYGDNYQADIIGCTKQDIIPVFSPSLQSLSLNLPAVKNVMLKKYAAELEVSKEKPLIKMVKYFAPLIYDFTKWVVNQRKEGQSIFFCSRDMFMPYLIATKLMKIPDVHYLYVSRKALSPLILNGKDKILIDKMHTIFGNDVCRFKKQEGTKDCLIYLKNTGIKNNDIIVDIGYSGTSQRVIEQALNITLHGKYIQLGHVPPEFSNMDTKQYLNRMALTYVFLAEFIFTSPEDNMDGYKNGNPYFTPDHEQRKIYAREIVNTILDENLFNKINKMNLSVFDVEQMLIHLQNYPSYEMMELFNEPILTNRKKVERGINFDRDAILNGQLIQCYNGSYAKPLFKKMLEKDPELSCLVKLLP